MPTKRQRRSTAVVVGACLLLSAAQGQSSPFLAEKHQSYEHVSRIAEQYREEDSQQMHYGQQNHSIPRIQFLLDYRHQMEEEMEFRRKTEGRMETNNLSKDRNEYQNLYGYQQIQPNQTTQDSLQVLSAISDELEKLFQSPNSQNDSEEIGSENDIFEAESIITQEPLGGPEIDKIIEQDLKRQPKKFTFQCTLFLVTMVAVFLMLKWVKIRISQSKAEDSRLDIMRKRQIIKSQAFKNCLMHYEDNICVQYASEEEYMTIQHLKEQQRINMKTMIERERAERNEQQTSSKRFSKLHPSVIYERSQESSSQQDSLLMQSLQVSSSSQQQKSYGKSQSSGLVSSASSHSSSRSNKSNRNLNKSSSKKSGRRSKKSSTPKESIPLISTSNDMSESLSFENEKCCSEIASIAHMNNQNPNCGKLLAVSQSNYRAPPIMTTGSTENLTQNSSSFDSSNSSQNHFKRQEGSSTGACDTRGKGFQNLKDSKTSSSVSMMNTTDDSVDLIDSLLQVGNGKSRITNEGLFK